MLIDIRASVRLTSRGLTLLLIFLRIAQGQSNLATITGIISDPGQAVVPGVTITIRNVETNIARTMTTNQSGDFTITNLHPGIYEISAEVPGFRTYRRSGIVLEVGQALRNDIQLEVGASASR